MLKGCEDAASSQSPPTDNNALKKVWRLLVPQPAPSRPPMELIHHFFELQRSKFSERIAIRENEATPKETEELQNSVLSGLQNLAVEQGLSTDGDCGWWGDKEGGGPPKYDIDGDKGNWSVGDNHWNGGQSRNTEYAEGIEYPFRIDAEDCSYYMKFGSCKFGLNCRFNHPPRGQDQVFQGGVGQRDGYSQWQGQCKVYLESGWCKYGANCKYSHGSDKTSSWQTSGLNSKGLPLRPGEVGCSFYMRTGSCKYGENCRFDHSESANQGSSTENYASLTNYGSSSTNSERNTYQATTYAKSGSGFPVSPAFSMNGGMPSVANFTLQQGHSLPFEEYPERPGQPECNFFMKTGDCKFKSNCKFHHPKIPAPSY